MVCFANDDIKPHQLVTLHINGIQHASKFIDDFDELLLGLLFSLFQPFQFGCESFFDLVLEPYQLALDVILYKDKDKDKDRNSNTRRNVMGSNVRYGEILMVISYWVQGQTFLFHWPAGPVIPAHQWSIEDFTDPKLRSLLGENIGVFYHSCQS